MVCLSVSKAQFRAQEHLPKALADSHPIEIGDQTVRPGENRPAALPQCTRSPCLAHCASVSISWYVMDESVASRGATMEL